MPTRELPQPIIPENEDVHTKEHQAGEGETRTSTSGATGMLCPFICRKDGGTHLGFPEVKGFLVILEDGDPNPLLRQPEDLQAIRDA